MFILNFVKGALSLFASAQNYTTGMNEQSISVTLVILPVTYDCP